MAKKFEVEAGCARDRVDVIQRELYRRFELNLSEPSGDIEGEIFIKKSIAPPDGSKLRVTLEVLE
jgi:hypothetical protein